jgi:hypothetical protein
VNYASRKLAQWKLEAEQAASNRAKTIEALVHEMLDAKRPIEDLTFHPRLRRPITEARNGFLL